MLPLLTAVILTVTVPDTLPTAATFPHDTGTVMAAGDADGPTPARQDALVFLAPIRRFPTPERPALVGGGDTAALAFVRQPPIEHGDAYYTRLTIHRWTGYAAVPLLVAQYVVGSQLDDDGAEDGGHSAAPDVRRSGRRPGRDHAQRRTRSARLARLRR